MRANHFKNISVARCIPLAALALVVAGTVFVLSTEARITGGQKQSSGVATGNPQNGKAVFENMGCNKCHGSEGEGVAGSGQNAGVPRIAATSLSLRDFLQQVRKPKGVMPPYSGQRVSDADLTDVYAFLESLKSAAERAAPTSASTTNGERLFRNDGCYECHGLQGQGSTSTGAARIGPPRIPLSAFVSYVREPSGEMPPYTAKALSDQDLAEIYDFLKSIAAPPPAKSIPLLNQ